MAIIETMTETLFVSRFREIKPDNFSFEALRTLFQYFDELSEETGENIEFDPIAICCDFSELDEKSAMGDYGYLFNENDIDEEDRDHRKLVELLQDETTVFKLENGNYRNNDRNAFC